MALLIERLYPFVGGLAVATIYLSAPPLRQYVMPDTVPSLLAAIVSVGGIAVGFLATAKSILISIDDRPIVQRIKAAGAYQRILSYMRSGIFWSFVLTVYSALALLFKFDGHAPWTWPMAIATAAWLLIASTAILSYHRISRVWYAVLDRIDTKQP